MLCNLSAMNYRFDGSDDDGDIQNIEEVVLEGLLIEVEKQNLLCYTYKFFCFQVLQALSKNYEQCKSNYSK